MSDQFSCTETQGVGTMNPAYRFDALKKRWVLFWELDYEGHDSLAPTIRPEWKDQMRLRLYRGLDDAPVLP